MLVFRSNRMGNLTVPSQECNATDPVSFYWYRMALNLSTSIDKGWYIHVPMLLAYSAVWILLMFSLHKGIKSSGKVISLVSFICFIRFYLTLILVDLTFLRKQLTAFSHWLFSQKYFYRSLTGS